MDLVFLAIGGLIEMETSRTRHYIRALLMAALIVISWYPLALYAQDVNDPFVIPYVPVETYSGGAGSPQNPFLISTVADLGKLAGKSVNWDRCFKLTQDLDLEGKNLTPIGTLLKPFTGSFNGAYYRIKNLHVYDTGSAGGGVGLFGVVRGANASLAGVILENPTIIGNSADNVGALVGLLDGGTVCQCAVVGGRVFGSVGRDSCTGGLAGANFGGVILECYSTAMVEGISASGGLVASNKEGGAVEDSYAKGRVVMRPLWLSEQAYYCGGLVGLNRGSVSYCYADTPMSILAPGDSNGYSGGLIGGTVTVAYPYTSWVLTCFSNGIHGPAVGNGNVPPGGAAAVSSAALMQRATFKHWDFGIVWSIDMNTMPTLRWENPEPVDGGEPNGL
jgi:hypothetical protein